MEIIHNPGAAVFALILFGVGLMAITYIAIIMFLDLQPEKEPIALPEKH